MSLITPFRRAVQHDTKRTGGRGRKGAFYERFRFPTTQPAPILLINATYTDPNPAAEEIENNPQTGRPMEVKKPYFKFRKHKRVLLKNGVERYPEIVCSAGYNPHNPQPCAGCSAIDSGDKSVSVSDMAAVGIVHLAVYHKHPLLDRKTNGIVMKQAQQGRQPEPVMIDDECEGRTCNYCRVQSGQPPINDPQNPWPNYRPQDIQTFFGKRRYVELGKNHLQHLIAWDATLSSMCGNDGAQLITDGFKCPTCGNLVIDMAQETRNDVQIAEAVSKPYPCLHCNRPVLLEEVIACEVCEQNNRQPRQFTMFDRVLWGIRQGEKTNSQLVLHRHESLQEFFARVPPQLLGGKTPEQLLADLAKPYEFDQVLQPHSLQDQIKYLELQAPAPQYPQYQQAPAPQYQQAPPPMAPQYGAPQFQQAPPAAPAAAPGPAAPAPSMRPNFTR